MFRDALTDRILVFDGGMGTSLQNIDIPAEAWQNAAGCSEILNITAPETVADIHRKFFEAGADVVETNTFGATRLILAEYGLEERTREIALAGAQIARRVADEADGRMVAGSMGPGTKLPSLSQISFDDLVTLYTELADALIEGGVDVLIIETCQDALQVKAAVIAARNANRERGCDVPVMVSITVEASGTMLLGTEPSAVAAMLKNLPVDCLGINCAVGPDMMHAPLTALTESWDGPISLIPNAGLPEQKDGQTVYSMEPARMAEIVAGLVDEFPVAVIGGCCGTTYDHIAAMSAAVEGKKPNAPRPEPYTGTATSLYARQPLVQQPAPALIGERANANGSKKFRELLLAEDFDGMLAVAKEQEEGGAHFIDVCVAYAGRDEAADMTRFTSKLATSVTLPLVIDSTEPAVVHAAMKNLGAKTIINSINYEDGGEKLDAVLDIIEDHPAACIALTIDETGMAMTADTKFAVAKRLYNAWTARKFAPEDLIIDPLTFSVGSGDESLTMAAQETLGAIRRIKTELPGVKTVLGVSNVSFGLSKDSRPVLNSVFVHEAVEAGLDMAIVHASKLMPESMINDADRQVCRALLNGEDGALSAFIEHFADFTAEVDDEQEDLAPGDKLKKKLMRGDKTDLPALLESLRQEMKPLAILNDLLLPAMQEVGELFGAGKMLLPFVLSSAEVMKESVRLLEPHMERKDTESRGTVVLATVRGDVHDIGKNLVDIILSNNGYTVHNMGIKIGAEEMIEKARAVNADAVGMSGLLVKSTQVMKENIERFAAEYPDTRILLGGAALTRTFVTDSCEPLLPERVHYCRDAFDALSVLSAMKPSADENRTSSPKPIGIAMPAYDAQSLSRASHIDPHETGNEPMEPAAPFIDPEPLPTTSIARIEEIPEPPFWGVKHVTDIDIADVFEYINRYALFTTRWGYRKKGMPRGEFDKMLKKVVTPEFEVMRDRVIAEKLVEPKVAYGYFRCRGNGTALNLYSDDGEHLRTTFRFPRAGKDEKRSISDYFLDCEAAKFDVVPMQVVSLGMRPVDFCRELFAADEYKDYFMFHAMFTELAEGLAEYWHRIIRQDLKIDKDDAGSIDGLLATRYRGRRYSFGYPACPDLSYNMITCNLLGAAQLGISVSETFEMVPEYTTCALITHHPQSEYFAIG